MGVGLERKGVRITSWPPESFPIGTSDATRPDRPNDPRSARMSVSSISSPASVASMLRAVVDGSARPAFCRSSTACCE